MTIGQHSNYKQSLKYYLKGIEIFENEFKNDNNNSETRTLLAGAYASIAELYMTSDLWYN